MSLRRFSVMLLSTFVLCASALFAQTQEAPKVEVFGGYSWYHAGGNITGIKVPDFNKGWGAQLTYNLNHWAGIAIDGGGHYNDFAKVHSLAIGPQIKFRMEGVTPFIEGLVGGQHFAPVVSNNQFRFAALAGGGIDYPVTRRLSIRPIQVDYVYSAYHDPSHATDDLRGVRLQAGLIYNFGVAAQEGAVSAACTADPQAVDAGAPVKIVATPSGFLPKRTLTYSYATTGGKVAGTSSTTTVDTTGLAPGSYTVTAKAVDNGKGKHQQTASCQASFSVNEPPKHPPVLSISANPTSLVAGDSSTITATGSSPDNRPLSYNCTSTGGRLTGNGPTYTLDTAGVPESTITVNCTVSDDRNLTASSNASVKVSVPPPPPTATDFGSIEFKHDLKRPTRVDNEAKGELDRYADALAAAPDSKGVVVGYATAAEATAKKGSKKVPNFAAERAVNTKDYMVKEKGIDPSRIEVRTGTGEDQKTELWVVPAGATFSAEGTHVVDEGTVKATPRVAPAKVTHRKAHKS